MLGLRRVPCCQRLRWLQPPRPKPTPLEVCSREGSLTCCAPALMARPANAGMNGAAAGPAEQVYLRRIAALDEEKAALQHRAALLMQERNAYFATAVDRERDMATLSVQLMHEQASMPTLPTPLSCAPC